MISYEIELKAIAAQEKGVPLASMRFDDRRIDKLIDDWRGTVDMDTGKAKTLSRKQVLAAIVNLESKGEFNLLNLEFYIES